MIAITEKRKCSGCYACANICPKQCIAMETDTEGFWYPKVDAQLCIDCRRCETVCPIAHRKAMGSGKDPVAFAAINQCEKTRMESSSGGVFTLLAENILSKGGVVFGAAFMEAFQGVGHISVQHTADLAKLRGSKYLQSKIGNTYQQAEAYLKQDKAVLFTGTPCQIAGLYAYLGKEYENLYTQDIICHGVPSPLIWQKYVQAIEMAGGKLQEASFRNKRVGWKQSTMRLLFENGEKQAKTLRENLYLRGFLADLFLRPSCYDCAFKGIQRVADITLADFWGIQNVLPEMDDDKGTSLVLVHSPKGQALMEEIGESLHCRQVDVSEAVAYNAAAVRSAKMPVKRQRFLNETGRKPLLPLLKKYTTPSVYVRTKRLAKRILRKLLRR